MSHRSPSLRFITISLSSLLHDRLQLVRLESVRTSSSPSWMDALFHQDPGLSPEDAIPNRSLVAPLGHRMKTKLGRFPS